jgi:hypothetical protein
VSIAENGGSLVVTVTLSASSSNVVTVHYSSSDSTATAGLDYTAVSGTLTFSPGEISKTITMAILDDALLEFNELFHVELSNSTNASIQDYQSLITVLDNEVAPVPGCTDADACNYNASATQDNGSCTYPSQSYLNCGGSCINDTDSDGICNENEVPGCTDATACNYNASATDDNATCTYPAQTYLNCAGNCINDTDNDGICNELEVPGCTDPTACNYNATATEEDATCTYPEQTYLNCDGSCINDSDSDGICNENETEGCTDPSACNYSSAATDNNGSCEYASLAYYQDNDFDGDGSGDLSLFCENPGPGYSANENDCDDTNALINTLATEVCDEVDNDCDGEVDEFVTNTYYTDADGDGFGDSNESIEACVAPDGFVDNSDDCDDNLLTFEDLDGDGYGTSG